MFKRTTTAAEQEEAYRLFEEGHDTNQIAKIMSIHEAAISRAIHNEREARKAKVRHIGLGDYDTTRITDYHKR